MSKKYLNNYCVSINHIQCSHAYWGHVNASCFYFRPFLCKINICFSCYLIIFSVKLFCPFSIKLFYTFFCECYNLFLYILLFFCKICLCSYSPVQPNLNHLKPESAGFLSDSGIPLLGPTKHLKMSKNAMSCSYSVCFNFIQRNGLTLLQEDISVKYKNHF